MSILPDMKRLDAHTVETLRRLAEADRTARQQADAVRTEFLAALRAARRDSTVRELAEIVGLSFQRIAELTRPV